MSTYVRLQPVSGAFDAFVELTAEQFAAMQANGKAQWLRPFTVDPQPVPASTQNVVDAGIVIDASSAHRTWALVDKTTDELEADALKEEKAQLVGWLTDIQAQLDISNSTRAAMSNAQRINELEKDTRVLLKVAKRYVRQQKRAL